MSARVVMFKVRTLLIDALFFKLDIRWLVKAVYIDNV